MENMNIEEPEPTLKYERICNDITNIINKDFFSCFTLHNKFLALGTTWGCIYILDHHGNKIETKDLATHSSNVNQISIDNSGEYIASCSHDGRVLISGIYSSELNYLHRFDTNIYSIAINPLFGKASVSKLFLVGTNKVTLFEKTIIGKKSSIIYNGGFGTINNIEWEGNYIAWVDQKVIKIYDIVSNCTIGSINREAAITVGNLGSRCCLKWYLKFKCARDSSTRKTFPLEVEPRDNESNHDNDDTSSLHSGSTNCSNPQIVGSPSIIQPRKLNEITSSGTTTLNLLLVGYSDQIKICKIVRTSTATSSHVSPSSNQKITSLASNLLGNITNLTTAKVEYVQIIMTLSTHFYVCGLTLYPDLETLAVLAYPKKLDDEDVKDVSNILTEDDDNTNISPSEEASELPENMIPPPKASTHFQRPQIHIIKPKGERYYEESVNDALSIKDWLHTSPELYHFGHLRGEEMFYVASCRDIILGRKRTHQDHIQWLLEKKDYKSALEASIHVLEELIQTSTSFNSSDKSIHPSPPSLIKSFTTYESDQIFPAITNTFKVAKIYVDDLIAKSSYAYAAGNVIQNYYYFPFHGMSAAPYHARLSSIKFDQDKLASLRNLLVDIWTDSVYKFAKSRKLLSLVLPDFTHLQSLPDFSIDSFTAFNIPPFVDISFTYPKPGSENNINNNDNNRLTTLPPQCYHLLMGDLLGIPTKNINLEVTSSTLDSTFNLQFRQKILYRLLQLLPSQSFDVNFVINMIYERYAGNRGNKLLAKSLAYLYSKVGNYPAALNLYLTVGEEKELFDLLTNNPYHDLSQELMKDSVLNELLRLNEHRTLEVLTANVAKIPIGHIVKKFENNKPVLLLRYLDEVYRKDANISKDFHDLQVKLYAQHNKSKLLPFLKTSQHYSSKKAVALCQANQLYHEIHYLYVKAGDTRKALNILVVNLKDVLAAIEFCKEQDDASLWSELINLSMDKPEFVTVLLQNVGTFMDPLILIQQIKTGMKIQGLRDSLVKILRDYQLQTLIQENCNKILMADTAALFQEKFEMSSKAFTLRDDATTQSINGLETGKYDGLLFNQNAKEIKAKCYICKRSLFQPSPANAYQTKSPDSQTVQKTTLDDLAFLKSSKKEIENDKNEAIKDAVGVVEDRKGQKQQRLSDIIIYYCNHAFHTDCLSKQISPIIPISLQDYQVNCPICAGISHSFKSATTLSKTN